MSGLVMKYFVLKPEGIDIHAEASRRAMYAYASYLEEEGEELVLARDLSTWAGKEVVKAELRKET